MRTHSGREAVQNGMPEDWVLAIETEAAALQPVGDVGDDYRALEQRFFRLVQERDGLVERIATAVHEYILATEPQTTGAGIVGVIRGFRSRAASVTLTGSAIDRTRYVEGVGFADSRSRAASVEPFAASGWDPREDPESSLHEPPRCECGELEQNRVHHGVGRTLYHPFRAVSVDDEGTYPGGAVQKAVDEFVMPDDFPGDPDYREPPR